jgi:microcystin-dependent protein
MGFSIRRTRDAGTASAQMPAGSVTPFAGQTAPSGWLLCAGQEVAIASYSELYTVCGTLYGALTNGSGGAGSSHFRVPDLRGRTVAGVDNMGGSAASRLTTAGSGVNGVALGAVGGAETHTLTGAQSGTSAHSHTASSGNDSPDHNHGPATGGNSFFVNVSSGGDVLNGGGSQYRFNFGSPWTATGGASARHTHSITVNTSSAANASSAHNNTQPTLILNYIIKA